MANNPTPSTEQVHFLLIIIGIVLPPLAIFLVKGNSIWNKEFWVSLLLTTFGHIPGAIFALYYMICIEFVKRRGDDEGGYHRLPDDEESQLRAEATATDQDGPTATNAKLPVPGGVPPPAAEGSSSNTEAGGDLPAYEDIVGLSQPPLSDTKANGDNKVQH
ncbi:uncharacterized protein J8A68_001794 [[Candida] subhashii]|uniref:Uncharacterized protein n=1 Tax=[Candida] subhashii TaxID=561895 RepID=A0A8J5URJ6_9ASCO|nr:uncharacterized protein J8A68_001794 [[Candida] subhashii]KAG7664697.1 hypothetical protein J8A68_001794 [[Candida] subhashii]